MMIGLVLSFADLFAQPVKLEAGSPLTNNAVTLNLFIADTLNPPANIASTQGNPPFWSLFLIYGDGAYKTVTVLPFIEPKDGYEISSYPHIYRMDGGNTFKPMAIMTAVYSRDRANKRVAAPPMVVPTTGDQTLDWTPFAGEYEGKNLKLATSWRSARPKDTLYVALSYARPEGIDTTTGDISLIFDRTYFEWIGQPFAGQLPAEKLAEGNEGPTDYKIKWKFTGYSATEAHRTFFVMLRVKDDFNLPDNVVWNTPITMGINWAGQDTPKGRSDRYGIDLSGEAKGVTSSEYAASYFQDTTQINVGISKSNDPNRIYISPDCFLSGQEQGQRARITVTFLNKGAASVQELSVRTSYDVAQWNASRSGLLSYHPRDGVNISSELGSGYFHDTFIPVVEGRSLLSSVRQLQEAKVPPSTPPGGSDPAQQINPYIGGHITFNLNTLPELRAGDSLRMRATIYMDQDKIQDYEAAAVCRSCYQRLRWHYGLKYLVYLPGSDLLTRGHGLRATLSRNLDPVRERIENRYISLQNLPAWWLQWEAGISGLSLDGASGDSLRLQYIDVVPLQLRWAPRKGFGSLSQYRRIGFSAGYTFSYLYRGTVEGATFTPKSAADRIEHSVGGSIDYGNILRRPGLSFGLGYNLRWTRYNSAVQRYGHPYVYVHYNLPYRLRF